MSWELLFGQPQCSPVPAYVPGLRRYKRSMSSRFDYAEREVKPGQVQHTNQTSLGGTREALLL
jgi:hypothetical protein